jgi:GT2 family glycosyltransferase
MAELSIAAVLTCFNRREKTEACLDALFGVAERMANRVRLHIIVTDDGSIDGTSEMLSSRFPDVEVLHGDGGLFWNGGMRLAFGRALEQEHDFYLWVNDDTTLYPDCLENLLATHELMLAKTGQSGLVVGSTCNDDGKVTYGGLYRPNPRKPLKFALVEPASVPQPCESNNGNCLLISAEAARQLGNLEAAYVHGMGDMDYGLRATKMGIPLWVMSGFVGKCGNDHPLEGSYLDSALPFTVRWKKALSSKELSPRAWGLFCKRHAGLMWPVYWAWPYAKVALTSLTRTLKPSE